MTTGTVYLVGAGPGDPGLLTVRGRELLARSEVVVYDALVSPRLLEHAPASAERIYAGKRGAAHALEQEEINRLLVARARSGATVVRLKGGDPFVFGRGGEEALALAEAGVPFEVVPGVTAGLAAAACAGIPATHRGLASAVSLVTGHETPGKEESAVDWPALARTKGTLIFYMGVERLGAICARLIEAGLAADTPACAIRWGTTPLQRTVAGTLAGLPEQVQAAGLTPPAVLVVGAVVALRDKLAWFEARPLFGRRVVVTRARAQASAFAAQLEALGAEVVEWPAIRIEPAADLTPLRAAVARLASYDWIFFTSVNAVDVFFALLHESGRDARALAGHRLVAIGPATADRLNGFGIRPDVQPAEYTSAAIVEALSARDLRGERILCPRADIAPADLPEALTRRGAVVTEVTAYRTVPDAAQASTVAAMLGRGEVHWLTFTSSSTVTNFFAAIEPAAVKPGAARIASIGPMTSAAVRRFGLEPAVEAPTHTIPGLIQAILRMEQERGARRP